MKGVWRTGVGATALSLLAFTATVAAQSASKPNIILLVGDDVGYGDLGAYGGGEGRGAPTPAFDRLAQEGITFFSFYAQPSCTPGRAAMQTGRYPNRSGMTTVAFQGQGGGLPAAEWTLASVLKTAGYATFFTGKWHLGEADYALPNAQGYDEMKYVYLYHLNAYTYGDPKWFPAMSDSLRDMFKRVTKGALEGLAGQPAKEVFKVNGEYVNTPEKGVVGIPYLDEYVEKATLDYLDKAAKSKQPFFMSVNFVKVHQPNMPHPDYIGKSMAKSKYLDALTELDARVGHVMDKVRQLGLDKNTIVFFTTDNGAWQDVYPDAGYTPFRGTKGTDMEGGNRVPSFAWWPGHIKADTKNHDILGGLDYMATFAALAGVTLPDKDRAGQPTIFDSYDMSPVLFGKGKSKRNDWFYFTEDELTPGAVRLGQFKFVFNLRGDGGAYLGGNAVSTNEGWKGEEKYVAGAPRLYDLWQDPQERYDILMTNWTENTWLAAVMGPAVQTLMESYIKYPPRPLQSEGYSGPIKISTYQRFKGILDQIKRAGFNIQVQ